MARGPRGHERVGRYSVGLKGVYILGEWGRWEGSQECELNYLEVELGGWLEWLHYKWGGCWEDVYRKLIRGRAKEELSPGSSFSWLHMCRGTVHSLMGHTLGCTP